MTRALVYRYACPYNVDFDEVSMTQLRLAHELHNELVSLWKQQRERIAEAWTQHPEVAECALAVEALEERREQAEKAWKQSKSAARDRKGNAEAKQALAEARGALKDARADLKVRKQAAYEALAPRFHELNEQYRASIKETYRRWVQEPEQWERDGEIIQKPALYWATYNLVRQQHMRAEQAIARTRKNGVASDLRFRRWSGEGQLSIQLQREAGKPERSPALLASPDSPWRNSVRLPSIPERKARLPFAMRIGSENRQPVWCELPNVIWHRPLPPEGDITDIRISRRRTAGNYRLWVEVTVKLPNAPASQALGTCGVNTGWRVMSDGSLRVAVWRTKGRTDALHVPPHLQDAVFASSEGGEVRIPKKWLDRWQRCSELTSQRDQALELLRADLLEHIDDLGELADAGEIKRWRSPRRFVYLATQLRDSGTPIAKRLEDWRRQDRHLWEWEANLRQKCIDFRADLFATLAANICVQNSIVVVEEPYVAVVTKKHEESDWQADAARRMARFAAPSSFISALDNAASARGVELTKSPSSRITVEHHA